MMASGSDNVRIINFLLKHGANVLLKDRNGKTALQHACRKDTSRSLKVLSRPIKNGADINAGGIDNCTPLAEATRHCYVNKARFFIEHGANVHLRHNIDGDTALHYAIGQSLPEVVSALLAAGTSAQVYSNNQLTPLLLASMHTNIAMVDKLIK